MEIEHVTTMLQDSVKDIRDISLQGGIIYYPLSYLEDFAVRNTVDQATLEAGTKLGNDNLAEENDPILPQPKEPSEQPSGVDTSIKRKHVKDNADAPTAKRLKPSRPDFLTMKAPLLDSGRNLIDPIRARIHLEGIFNGTFREWAAEESFSEISKEEIKEWRKMVDGGKGFIKDLVP